MPLRGGEFREKSGDFREESSGSSFGRARSNKRREEREGGGRRRASVQEQEGERDFFLKGALNIFSGL